jgi:phosphopantetheinyl transferase (holo-ACP synthase)
MDEQVKNIVSKYIKVPAEKITADTVIDRSAVASSIILHRMYAQLANEGVAVKEYTAIKTFGQLIAGVNGKEMAVADIETSPVVSSLINTNELPVGIDIENVSSLPVVKDFREDAFYTMNFAPAEIAYCILQPSPYASFAGLFAAKEAIIKADNAFTNKPFNSIVIDHLPEGRPVYPGFQLSIAHTTDTAIAVAVKNISLPSATPQAPGNASKATFFPSLLAALAFVISLLTFILFFFKSC